MKEQLQSAITMANELQTLMDDIVLKDESLEGELENALDNVQYIIDDLESAKESI